MIEGTSLGRATGLSWTESSGPLTGPRSGPHTVPYAGPSGMARGIHCEKDFRHITGVDDRVPFDTPCDVDDSEINVYCPPQ